MADLRATLTQQGKAALQGMPGVGKTQLALKYAERHRQDYAAVLWVSAASRETLLSGFAALAEVLNLPERNEADQEKAIAAVQRWLDTTEQAWLLILDNADEPELLHEFLPSGRGHCLLTTRPQDVHALATAERVKSMEPADGALLLLRRAGRLRPEQPLDAAPKEQAAALALSAELGGLPLALDQAGAFVAATGVNLAEYLDLYRQRGQTLRAERGQLHLEHPSVTVTFTLAFEQVAACHPAAVDLLRACAFLHPDAIPEELLIKGALEWGEPLATALADPLAWAELFATLNRFSLLVRDPDAKTLTLHRVVQAVLQDEFNKTGQRRWAERAVRAVSRAFPYEEFSNWPECERLLPQARIAADWIKRWKFTFVEGGKLLDSTACYLHARGYYNEEEPLLQHALVILQRALSPEHFDILRTRIHIATWTGEAGNAARALALFQDLLPDMERVRGPDHRATLTIRSNIAHWTGETGDAIQALALFQDLLPDMERVWGSAHPDTLTIRNNIAHWTGETGDAARALVLFQTLLSDMEQVLDPAHPLMLTIRNNIATWTGETGDAARAMELFQALCPDQERVFGTNHPDTLATRHNLAVWTGEAGDAARALELCQSLLPDMERVLSPNHPNTLATRDEIAYWTKQLKGTPPP